MLLSICLGKYGTLPTDAISREPSVPYNVHFGGKKSDIGSENTHFWNINL